MSAPAPRAGPWSRRRTAAGSLLPRSVVDDVVRQHLRLAQCVLRQRRIGFSVGRRDRRAVADRPDARAVLHAHRSASVDDRALAALLHRQRRDQRRRRHAHRADDRLGHDRLAALEDDAVRLDPLDRRRDADLHAALRQLPHDVRGHRLLKLRRDARAGLDQHAGGSRRWPIRCDTRG